MNRKQITDFSKKMVMIVVLAEIAMCAATITLACLGYNMTTGVDVIKANTPFAVVVFAAYSGNSAVEKWLVHAKSGTTASATEDTAANG